VLHRVSFGASGHARRGKALRTPPGSKDSNGKEVSLGAADPLPGYFHANSFFLRASMAFKE